MEKRFQVLGITRDYNSCDCCGKLNLTKTVAILDTQFNTVSHFGISCAVKADKYDSIETANQIKKEIQSADRYFKQVRIAAIRFAVSKLGKIYGYVGDLKTGMKPNCDESIFLAEIEGYIQRSLAPS